MTVRLVVVDDQTLVRTGLRKIFGADPELEIVGEASDGLAAVEVVERLRPDVVVMDIRMPILDGLEATRRLAGAKENGQRILVLTTFDLDEYVFEALRAGASGFMLKDAPPEELIAAVGVVARGDGLLAPGVTKRVIERFAELPWSLPELQRSRGSHAPRAGGLYAARPRLLERGDRRGARDQRRNAKTHVGRVLGKLGLRDRVQAVIFAYERGLA